jgi:hypothetical protein
MIAPSISLLLNSSISLTISLPSPPPPPPLLPLVLLLLEDEDMAGLVPDNEEPVVEEVVAAVDEEVTDGSDLAGAGVLLFFGLLFAKPASIRSMSDAVASTLLVDDTMGRLERRVPFSDDDEGEGSREDIDE